MLELLKMLLGKHKLFAKEPDSIEATRSATSIKQPTPRVSHADVERVVRRDFPPESIAEIMRTLENCGTIDRSRERDRIRLAALKLSQGDPQNVADMLRHGDWRDLLAAAEYPNYMDHHSSIEEMPEAEKKKLIEKDWKQYNEWLNRD